MAPPTSALLSGAPALTGTRLVLFYISNILVTFIFFSFGCSVESSYQNAWFLFGMSLDWLFTFYFNCSIVHILFQLLTWLNNSESEKIFGFCCLWCCFFV